MNGLDKVVNDLWTERADLRRENDELKAERDQFRAKWSNGLRHALRLKRQRDQLREEVEDLREANPRLAREADRLQDVLYDIGHSVGSLDILSATNAEIADAVKAQADPHTAAGLQTAVEELTAERDKLREEVEDFRVMNIQWQKSASLLESALHEISNALELDENVTHDEILAAVKEVVDNKNHWCVAYSVEAFQNDVIVANLREEIADLRERADHYHKERDELQAKLDESQQAAISWRDMAITNLAARDELQAKLDRLRGRADYYDSPELWEDCETLASRLFGAIKEATS